MKRSRGIDSIYDHISYVSMISYADSTIGQIKSYVTPKSGDNIQRIDVGNAR